MDTSAASIIHNGGRSRSNSSSSPAAAVKKQFAAATAAKHLDSRNAQPRTRPKSPERSMPPTSRFRYDRSRSRSRPENTLSPNLNINRWSHSTSSSISGMESDNIRARANPSSRRMSIGPSLVSSSTAAKTSMHIRRSSSQSPQVRQGSGSAFLQVERTHALRDLSPVGVSAHLTPTSMFNPSAGEYFGEAWQSHKTGKNGEAVAVSVHYMRTGTQPKTRPSENMTTQYMTQVSRPITRETRPATASRDESMDSSPPSNAPARVKSHRSPTQKTMLSKALAVANNAVLLDNAQNIEGAIEAYAEACDLLQQVLIRSSVLDDRKRLSDIRNAYSKRIADLHDLDDSFSELMEKALPEDPPLDETNNSFFSSDGIEPDTTEVLESVQIPPRQESLLPEIFGGESYLNESSTRKRIQIPSLAVPMDAQYMPPPLSPRRPASPISERDANTPLANRRPSDVPKAALHTREGSTESTSWLDTLEDGDSLTSRSSRLSSLDFGIQHNHNLVDDFEAEFDAALDAAVDAAYEDNLTEEPTPRPDKNAQDFNEEFRTPIPAFGAVSKDNSLLSSDIELTREYDEGDSSEEEERLLEEMTKGFVFDDFSFDRKSKSALPRQSDSSTFSGRTWTSSLPSTTATNNTTLSTLAESQEAVSEMSPRPAPPAKDAPLSSPPKPVLPQAPPLALSVQPSSRPISVEKHSGLNIRERRFSGRSGEQLKIETFARRNSSTIPTKPIAAPSSVPELDVPGEPQKVSQTVPSESTIPSLAPITPMTALPSNDSIPSDSPATPALTQGGSQGSIEDSVVMPPSPVKIGKMGPPAAVKKNLSSSSLRLRNLSVATTDTTTESPITPVSAGFGGESRKGVPPLPSAALPTPLTAAFGPQLLQAGGMYLFDDITATAPPRTPRSPEAPSVSPPQLLEPCPESFLLRPFWLMRCLYQSLSHPKGGYLTTKLFIPRDVWKVRNVKLKALDDKVSQCDLLTAALLKLAKVDTFDADSVLDELQSFEVVLDQVRNNLQKKMGNDVGFSGSSALFKSAGEDQEIGKSTSTAAKSIASSWRKLRSKSSAPAMGHQSGQKDGPMAGPSMASLPMTSSSAVASSRSHLHRKIAPPPTPTQLANIQPVHAAYMSSLARLFEAAQVLDDIARQVEDPGLKCSNKTQVGLELGVKNAAEFFAFFVIRFVMADLMLMVDKFLKRGSEWVLS
ncbi:hypothetical protein AYL99_06083 [Fonsecaea erecta]|uniref:MIT domain-containing protein n=1 Tax=Fonsecaea erecta TaxID=1367422 RepID=A0A178ZH54_9EURO|nr:hypothetical protein AYL99_06083 [Fonsecaea erecta]OAP58786.1 hypothetical protein AYL99_06083 [Fonsecaea erecta]